MEGLAVGVSKHTLVRGSSQSTGVCETTRENNPGCGRGGREASKSAVPGPGIDSGIDMVWPFSFIEGQRLDGRALATGGCRLLRGGRGGAVLEPSRKKRYAATFAAWPASAPFRVVDASTMSIGHPRFLTRSSRGSDEDASRHENRCPARAQCSCRTRGCWRGGGKAGKCYSGTRHRFGQAMLLHPSRKDSRWTAGHGSREDVDYDWGVLEQRWKKKLTVLSRQSSSVSLPRARTPGRWGFSTAKCVRNAWFPHEEPPNWLFTTPSNGRPSNAIGIKTSFFPKQRQTRLMRPSRQPWPPRDSNSRGCAIQTFTW